LWFSATFGFTFTICWLGSELKNVKNLIIAHVSHQAIKRSMTGSEALHLKFHDTELKIFAMETVEIDMELFVEVCVSD
jgi:hypothetical protein